MHEKKVLSLGQCAADHGSISGLLRTEFTVETTAVRTVAEALNKLRQDDYTLVLVNRVLDYDGESGVEFIDQLKQDPKLRAVPVMLVSNYADAQEEAVARGALPGFGKSALWRPETLERLRTVLGDKE